MDETIFGNGAQNEPTYNTRELKGEDVDMNEFETSIKELNAEIEAYREAAINAEAALDSAEKELDAVLTELCN